MAGTCIDEEAWLPDTVHSRSHGLSCNPRNASSVANACASGPQLATSLMLVNACPAEEGNSPCIMSNRGWPLHTQCKSAVLPASGPLSECAKQSSWLAGGSHTRCWHSRHAGMTKVKAEPDIGQEFQMGTLRQQMDLPHLVEEGEPWVGTDDACNLREAQIAVEPWISKFGPWRQEAPVNRLLCEGSRCMQQKNGCRARHHCLQDTGQHCGSGSHLKSSTIPPQSCVILAFV